MSLETNASAGAGTLPNWFAAVCLALIVLLIHNPYILAPAKAAGLNVSHLPSYRATVAASELQHFTPASAKSLFTVRAGLLWNGFGPSEPGGAQPHIVGPQVASPPQQFWCPSLRFRPPPL